MLSQLNAANVGSAVRWAIVNGGALLAAQGVLVGFDWTAAAGAIASLVMLGWSFWANTKKVA